MELFFIIIKLVFGVVLTLCLVLISLKLTGNKYNSLQKGRYIKVIEKIQLSKEISIVLLQTGDKGYVMSCSPHSTEKLEELDEETMKSIIANKEQYGQEMMKKYSDMIGNIKIKGFKGKIK
ncbi:flagellar biosynthetic protein FliO [Clostridium sp. C8-1-8]|jgi:flagellar protein FliO/FliZ|uniref:flagellar biosynthetic protein FliO n=1 Tax=Clostridium sp. C8-1-8 TaxID=2698831 RepID=UPI00136ADCD6|nr:flagellar biosynthetic protein FliO [Clostridium sp. C8-1-8]